MSHAIDTITIITVQYGAKINYISTCTNDNNFNDNK